MNWKKTLTMFFVLAISLLTVGCAEKREEALERLEVQNEANRHAMESFAMDTLINVTIYSEDGEELLVDAEQEIRRLERLFSITMEESDISKINASAGIAPVGIASDTLDILTKGQEMSKITNNAFNMAISPVVKAWGFTTDEEKKVPQMEEIARLLPLTNIDDVQIDSQGETGYLSQKGMAVDLGGIAKGYTSDAVTRLLKEKGVTSSLIYLGGNISAIGSKGNGDPWKVAVENPLDSNDYVGLLEVRDKSVITSGGYQRYFEEDGKRYHHIIDSKTGQPAESGLLSVTIISENGTKADALSTALFVMGLEDGVELWRNSNDFEVIFVTADGKVIATEGAATFFTFEGRDNDFVYEIVKS